MEHENIDVGFSPTACSVFKSVIRLQPCGGVIKIKLVVTSHRANTWKPLI